MDVRVDSDGTVKTFIDKDKDETLSKETAEKIKNTLDDDTETDKEGKVKKLIENNCEPDDCGCCCMMSCGCGGCGGSGGGGCKKKSHHESDSDSD